MNKTFRFFVLVSVFVLSLTACGARGQEPTPTTGPEAIFTAAALTLQAQLPRVTPLATAENIFPTLAAQTQAANLPTTLPAPPTLTPIVLPSLTPIPVSPSPSPSPTPRCNAAAFVTDVTIPDGATISQGVPFRKTWRIKNVGTCTWTPKYSIVFDSGNSMGAAASFPISTGSVLPNDTVDISIDFGAPLTPGEYTSKWKLRDGSGASFGVGKSASNSFWAKIKVIGLKTGWAYDFTTSYCSAQWTGGTSGGGTSLPCPGKETDANGFVIYLLEPKLETGDVDNDPALYTYPKWVDNGVITGKYPAFSVQAGDRFVTVLGCLYRSGGSSCNIRFQLNYIEEGSSTVQNLGEWVQTYDNTLQAVNLPLDAIAGKTVHFVLAVLANGPATHDSAFWLSPHIAR